MSLFSLSKRRLQGDLIKVFKIFNGFDNININDYVATDLTNTTRNNGFKIIGKRFRSNEVKHFFFSSIVNIWNYLPLQIVNSNTIESFKKYLDKHLASIHQIEYFIPAYYFSSGSNSVDYSCFLTFLYEFPDSLSMLHGIPSSSIQLRLEGLEGWVGRSLPLSCPFVSIK